MNSIEASCGQGDTLENVQREVADYVQQKTADMIGSTIDRAFRGSKNVKVSKPSRQPRRYRFYIDLG